MNDNAIQRIQAGDLRGMSDREGLILQGCGGDLKEWVDGINDMLTESGILQNESRFEEAYTFKNENLAVLFQKMNKNRMKIAVLRKKPKI